MGTAGGRYLAVSGWPGKPRQRGCFSQITTGGLPASPNVNIVPVCNSSRLELKLNPPRGARLLNCHRHAQHLPTGYVCLVSPQQISSDFFIGLEGLSLPYFAPASDPQSLILSPLQAPVVWCGLPCLAPGARVCVVLCALRAISVITPV